MTLGPGSDVKSEDHFHFLSPSLKYLAIGFILTRDINVSSYVVKIQFEMFPSGFTAEMLVLLSMPGSDWSLRANAGLPLVGVTGHPPEAEHLTMLRTKSVNIPREATDRVILNTRHRRGFAVNKS